MESSAYRFNFANISMLHITHQKYPEKNHLTGLHTDTDEKGSSYKKKKKRRGY